MDMLRGDAIAQAHLVDWRKLAQGLHARFLVDDFGAGVRFVAAVGEAGDAVGHHPRASIGSGHVDLDVPWVGKVPLASAIGFDTGVYLVVFGGAMLILSMLGTIKPSRTRVAHLGVIEPGQRSTRTGEI